MKLIADVCFKAGYIDSWGRGTIKIFNSCKEVGLPEPEITALDGGILVAIYKKSNDQASDQVSDQVSNQDSNQDSNQVAIDNTKIAYDALIYKISKLVTDINKITVNSFFELQFFLLFRMITLCNFV